MALNRAANDKMLDPKLRTTEAGMELLGELHRLSGQLGSPQGLIALGTAPLSLAFVRGTDLAALQQFLESYCSQILIPHELPAIYQAYRHASRYEVRELIAADCKLDGEPKLQRFASVSRRLGVAQLQKLRPLRDQRLVQRYWEAVENGEAHGWHTIVYGLILAVYSLPLRQGLLNYGEQVIRGFIESGRHSFKAPSEQSLALHEKLCAPLPKAVESILSVEALAFAPQ